MAKKGVKAVFSDDNKTVTVWCYPSASHTGMPYKLVKKTWKNECPSCKKKGKLSRFKFNTKGTADGELTCKSCDMDYCGASGKEKWIPCRAHLIPATETVNDTTKVADSKTKADKCSMTKAEALTKAKEALKTGKDYKATLKIPIMKNIHIGDRVQINLPQFESTKKKKLYITEIKEDIDNQTYDITLSEDNEYGTKYDGEYIVRDSAGRILSSSSNNPYQAKCENVNVNIGIKDDSAIGKKIKAKGQQLGSIREIYKWLRVKSGGGTGGWKYKKWGNHKVKSEDSLKFGPKSAEYCWKHKVANCVDFSWIMAKMGEGAGKKIGIRHGQYVKLNGEKTGHMWNTYKGKNYDCSSSVGITIEMKKVEEVK